MDINRLLNNYGLFEQWGTVVLHTPITQWHNRVAHFSCVNVCYHDNLHQRSLALIWRCWKLAKATLTFLARGRHHIINFGPLWQCLSTRGIVHPRVYQNFPGVYELDGVYRGVPDVCSSKTVNCPTYVFCTSAVS